MKVILRFQRFYSDRKTKTLKTSDVMLYKHYMHIIIISWFYNNIVLFAFYILDKLFSEFYLFVFNNFVCFVL